MALPGTDVNPAGRAPARLAVHCNLATGGPGAAMPHAPFGRPRRPLGTFPRGESTSSARRRTKPPTSNRLLMDGKEKMLPCFSHFAGFRLCGGDQRAFRSPFGNLRSPCCGWEFSQGIRCFLAFSVSQGFASAEATKGLSGRPLETFGPLAADGNFHKKWIVPSHQSTTKSVPVRRFRLPGTLLFSCSSSATQRP